MAYRIEVVLDTAGHTLSGSERLVYRNNSPDTLKEIWFHLYPNAYRDRNSVWAKELEKMKNFEFSWSGKKDRGYVDVRSFTIDGRAARYEVNDTRMKAVIDKSLLPGDSLVADFDFFVKVPRFFSSGRLGHKGRHYEIVQWYPKVCVYDQSGWHPDYYHAVGEFYGEFGSFDVEITLPQECVVGATGTLIEPGEELDRLARYAITGPALDSLKQGDRVVRTFPESGGLKTVRFIADDVHDFAWVADRKYQLIRDTIGNVSINVLYFKNDREWRYAADYARDAVRHYTKWYGPYPYENLTVVRGLSSAGMEYPNLVIIPNRGSALTRGLEQVIMHEVGHQWFYGVLGSNEMDEAWLDEGINTFSEVRYFEEKYGRWNNYFKSRFLPPFDQRTFHQMLYYLTASNFDERPVLTKACEFADEPRPISYATAAYSKPGLVVDMLRHRLGEETFDRAMQRYYAEYKFRHPSTADFIDVLQNESGQELTLFFDAWLKSTDYCDYAIKRVRRVGNQTLVTVERKGKIVMPVEVMVEDGRGLSMVKEIAGDSAETTVPFTLGKAHRVVLDPDEKLLESDRWNNFYPRKLRISPVIDIPSLDAYQVFFGPLLSYGSRAGVTLTAWLQGRRFYDYDFLIGRHQWTANVDYRPKIGNVGYGFAYQTPLHISKELKTRLNFGLSNGLWEHKANVGVFTKIKPSILSSDGHEFHTGLGYREVETIEYVDSLDFEAGTVTEAKLGYKYALQKRQVRAQLDFAIQSGKQILLGDYDFDKFSLTARPDFIINPDFKINSRLFAGFIRGIAPRHEEFFLTGSVRLSGLASILFSQSGTLSPQERVHFDGGGNAVGYYGRHLHSSQIAAFNVEAQVFKAPLRPFFDAAYIRAMPDPADNGFYLDAGIKVKYGPAAVYFPFWVSRPESGAGNIALRWVLELGI